MARRSVQQETRGVYGPRLRQVRNHRGWTQEQLAQEMAGRIGHPMNRATIAKIEGGRRPLEVGELVALAAALGVSPSSLFLEQDVEYVRLTERIKVKAETAAAWVNGEAPLDPKDARIYHSERPGVIYEKGGSGVVGGGES